MTPLAFGNATAGNCNVTQISFGAVVHYRIRPDLTDPTNPMPSLWRLSTADLASGYQIVARGIDDIQVQYVQASARPRARWRLRATTRPRCPRSRRRGGRLRDADHPGPGDALGPLDAAGEPAGPENGLGSVGPAGTDHVHGFAAGGALRADPAAGDAAMALGIRSGETLREGQMDMRTMGSDVKGREAGFALVVALLTLLLLTFLGLTLATTTSTELQIANNYRWSQQAYYNAEAGMELAKRFLRGQTVWIGLRPSGPGRGRDADDATHALDAGSGGCERRTEPQLGELRLRHDSSPGQRRGLVRGVRRRPRLRHVHEPDAERDDLPGPEHQRLVHRVGPSAHRGPERRLGQDYTSDDRLVVTVEGTAPYTAANSGTTFALQNRAVRVLETDLRKIDPNDCENLSGQVGSGPPAPALTRARRWVPRACRGPRASPSRSGPELRPAMETPFDHANGTLEGSSSAMSEKRPLPRWGWIRAAVSGLAIGLILILAGDGARGAVVTGIDPLEILKLQVRPNVILMLDTSGSMTEATNGSDMQSGDEPPPSSTTRSRCSSTSSTRTRPRSASSSAPTHSRRRRCRPATASSTPRSTRTPRLFASTRGTRTTAPLPRGRWPEDNWCERRGRPSNSTTTSSPRASYGAGATLLAGRTIYTVTNRTDCGAAKSTVGAATNPPTINIREVTSCTTLAPTVRPLVTFTFSGAHGLEHPHSANTCPGFLPRTALVDCQTQNQLDAAPPGIPIRQFLQNELLITAGGTIQGYTETAAGAVATQPTVGGLRAAGFTPIANVLVNLKQIFSGNFFASAGQHLQRAASRRPPSPTTCPP